MTEIAVLGCGPAGLLVAHAVERAGHTPNIFSRRVRSVIPGSQHLRGPVPDLTSTYPEGTIQFVRIGTAEGYAEKVYGDKSRTTGWEHYLQVYPSWNVIKAYDILWRRFFPRIVNVEIDQPVIQAVGLNYEIVISTIPAPVLCGKPEQHVFEGTDYYIRRLPTPPGDENHEIVVYNGLMSDPWYRWSILGGLCSIEYARWPEPAPISVVPDWAQGTKAIGNNCDCYSTIHRAGRWAEWRHGVTLIDAFHKAEKIMEELCPK